MFRSVFSHNLSSGLVKWKLMRSPALCSLQNSQALSTGSSEPIEMPTIMTEESEQLGNMDSQQYQILLNELEVKTRELEAKRIENEALRDALRHAQEGANRVTRDYIPVPVEKAKEVEVVFSSQKASRNVQEVLETELFSRSETLEGEAPSKLQEGREDDVNAGSVEGLEATKETLEEKNVETLSIALLTARDHPWPEWQLFLEQLEADDYFNFETTTDNKKSTENEELGQDSGRIKRAAMGFARQRNDILRALSRKNLKTVAQFGCPSTDLKAVKAAKRLRAFLQIEEGITCEPCELRTECSRAYSKPAPHETTTTTDIIRVLVVYSLVIGAYKRDLPEDVDAAARSLLSEVVALAKTPFNPSMTLPVPKKPDTLSKEGGSRNGSRLSPDDVRNKRRGFDQVDMKPGDWQCPECNYVNFQRNSECRECSSPRPLADLRPGDWQCHGCKFINFAKNRLCRKCNATRVITGELREGDWICPKCKFHNFSKNRECFDCQEVRPRSAGRGDDRGGGSLSRSAYSGKERGHPDQFDIPQRRDQISSSRRNSKHEEWKSDFKKKAGSPSWDVSEANNFTDDELDSDSDDSFSFDESVVDFSDDDYDDENDGDFQPRSSSAKRGGRGARATKASNHSRGGGSGGDYGQSHSWFEDFDSDQNGHLFGNDSNRRGGSHFGDNIKEGHSDDSDFDEWSPSPRQFLSAGGGRNSGDSDRGRSSRERRGSQSSEQSSREGRRPTQGSRGRRGGRGR